MVILVLRRAYIVLRKRKNLTAENAEGKISHENPQDALRQAQKTQRSSDLTTN